MTWTTRPGESWVAVADMSLSLPARAPEGRRAFVPLKG
jgi:hypothetical protein